MIFPIRMTRPVTPLLYVSHNHTQLLSIKTHGFIKNAHEGKVFFIIVYVVAFHRLCLHAPVSSFPFF